MAICCYLPKLPSSPAFPFPSKTSSYLLTPNPKSSTFSIATYCTLPSKLNNQIPQSPNRMFILGLGFVGQFFAKSLKNDNWYVSGTCTNEAKKKKLEEDMGFADVHLFEAANDTELSCLDALVDATHLLISIPPVVGIGDPVLYQYQDLLQSRLHDGNVRWLGYLSSTSVYGDCGGAWVDEDYPAKPTKDSAKARLLAEKGWLSLGNKLRISVQVFRLGGIYGPGRSAVDTIIKQESLTIKQRMREARRYTSRVHVADICQALKSSIGMPSLGRIYNVVDDEPAPRAEVFKYAETLVDKKWPQLIKASSSFISNSLNQEKVTLGEKRVLNARLKNELGVRLFHPTYRSGLDNIIKSMENPLQ